MGDLKREIGVWGLSSNIINIMVGAGIFVLPAIVAEGLGPASIIAYLFCGFLIMLVMLCFAEVGSIIVSSGGAYAYIEKTLGRYAGFVAAIIFLVATLTADAAVANAIAAIIGSFVPFFQNRLVQILFFLLIFSGLGFINVMGVKEGVGLVKIITIAKLTPLLLLMLLAWSNVEMANLAWEGLPTTGAIGQISLILFFAFQGGESGLCVSGEVRDPQRTIPRAIILSILGVLFIYILIQTISQGTLGVDLPSYKENPLGEVGNLVFGPLGLTLLTIGAAVSMFGNLTSEILSLPRVLYGATKDGVIPISVLARVHPKYLTPHVSIMVYAGIGFLMASFGGFEQLAILSSASILLIYLGVAVAVIKLRRTANGDERPHTFKIPGGYAVPIAASVIILWFLSNLSRNELLGIAAFILFLSGLYFLLERIKRPKEPAQTGNHDPK